MTKLYWPGTTIERSTNTGFTLGYTGEPIDWQPLENATKQRMSAAKRVEKARTTGNDRSTIHGLSRKSDDLSLQRRARSFLLESRESSQKSSDKRDALRRGGI